MKRAAYLAGLGALATVAALAFQPWRLAETTFERYVIARLSSDLGLAITVAGDGAFALLPTPRIVAHDVAFATADGTVRGKVPRLRVDLNLASLLTGNVAINHLILVSPQVDVALPRGGYDPIALLTSQAASSLPRTPRISVRENGSAFFRQGGTIVSAVRDIALDVSAREAGDTVEASGSTRWRGELVDFSFASNSAARATLPMVKIRSAMLDVDFASRKALAGATAPPARVEGQFQASVPSMARLASWLSAGRPVTIPVGKTTVSGALQLDADGAQMRNAVVVIGSDTLEGAFDWRMRDARWLLSGTFAGKSLDIGRPQAGIEPQWGAFADSAQGVAIDVDDLMANDVDVRLSLQRVRLPWATLSDVAVQVMARDQRLDLSIANAGMYRGAMRGRLTLERTEAGIGVRTQLTAERIDLGVMSADVADSRLLSGTGTVQYQIESSGRTAQDLITNASGRISFAARNGDFAGTNINDVMRRVDRQPLAVARDWRGGRTSFDQASFTGVLGKGSLTIGEAQVSGTSYRLALEGRVSLLERLFRVEGHALSVNGASQIPFRIVGPLLDPSVQVNARVLLERSGAAAPLIGGRDN